MPGITSAVNDVFNYLTAYAEKPHYKPLLVAPKDLAEDLHCARLSAKRAMPNAAVLRGSSPNATRSWIRR